MGEATDIAWTDHTLNPWWGCQRVSPGCEHCYAETFAKRVGLKVWGPSAERRFFGDKYWMQPHKWNLAAERAGVRRRVFCASMADVCEDRRDLDRWRLKLRAVIESTPWLDWQLLSKRPENFNRLLWPGEWPKNAWAGCTAEDQKRADDRIPHLLGVQASVRFVSYEPALGPVDFTWIPNNVVGGEGDAVNALTGEQCYMYHGDAPDLPRLPRLDWVIVGGESGPGARPFDVSWARDVIGQCRAGGVAVFVKQLGSNALDSERGVEAGGFGVVPPDIRTKDRKGGNMEEWSAELRVRQWPT